MFLNLMNSEKCEIECRMLRLKSCALKAAALLFLIVSSLLGDAWSSTINPGDEHSAKDIATAEEALKVVPGVVKATSDEIYSGKSKKSAQVLLTELM